MTDRVEWLRCLVLCDGHVDDRLRAQLDNTAFALVVEGGYATFTWKIDLATAEYAERHVKTFLTSFESDMLFQAPPGPRREFRLAQVHMRSGRGVAFGPVMTLQVAGPHAEANHRLQYPWLHHRYEGVPLVAALIDRYQRCRSGADTIAVTAYFCLSALEHSVPDSRTRRHLRDAFCQHSRIARNVRDTFGDLVSEVGTLATARKIGHKHELRELLPAETYWLETAMRQFIDRAGRLALGEVLHDELTMGDLPPVRPVG